MGGGPEKFQKLTCRGRAFLGYSRVNNSWETVMRTQPSKTRTSLRGEKHFVIKSLLALT